MTGQAVSVPVEFGALEARPRMTDAAFREVVARNRERVSAGAVDAASRRDVTPEDRGNEPDEAPGLGEGPHRPAAGSLDPDNPDTDAGERL